MAEVLCFFFKFSAMPVDFSHSKMGDDDDDANICIYKYRYIFIIKFAWRKINKIITDERQISLLFFN